MNECVLRQVINDMADDSDDYSILSFSSSSFNKLLKDFSQTSMVRLAMGYIFMVSLHYNW